MSKNVFLHPHNTHITHITHIHLHTQANWISSNAGLDRYRRHVFVVQQFLTMRILQGQIDKVARAAVKALAIYHGARGAYPVADVEFHNDALNGMVESICLPF